MPAFPLMLQTPRSVFRFDHEEQGPDGERVIVGTIQSFAWGPGSAQFACSMPDLLAFADLIYRAAGKQPRDVEQLVRVEHFAAAPPVEALARYAKTEEPTNDEVAAIRKRMMDGR